MNVEYLLNQYKGRQMKIELMEGERHLILLSGHFDITSAQKQLHGYMRMVNNRNKTKTKQNKREACERHLILLSGTFGITNT